MKTTSIHQEILLLAQTSFVSRQLMQEEDPAQQQQSRSAHDQLEEACWNGLIQLVLPEIFEEPLGSKNLFMWKVTGAEAYIGIELGNTPLEKETEFSIDPIAFLRTQKLS